MTLNCIDIKIILDVQKSDCPQHIKELVEELWKEFDRLGGDYSYLPADYVFFFNEETNKFEVENEDQAEKYEPLRVFFEKHSLHPKYTLIHYCW